MKPIFSILALATLALAGCAPTAAISTPSPTPTEIIVPTPTATPLPPTATATAIPNALENKQGQTLLGLGYEQAQLKEFTSFAEGEYRFPGDTVTYYGIIGTKADGTKDILAFKFSDNPNLIKLSGTELSNYAKEAQKSPISGSCFKKGYVGNQGDQSSPIMDINSVSTNIIVQFEKDLGGKKIIFKTGLMATQTDQGTPVPFLAILQMEDAANPGVDLLKNNFFWSSGLNSTLSNEVHSVEEWKGVIPKGKQIEFGVRYIPISYNIEGFSLFRDKFADEGYLKTLKSFFDSNGSEHPSDLIIVLPGSVTYTE